MYVIIQSLFQAQCTETEDNLMIDTDGMNDTQEYYSVSNNGKKKMYSCLLCKVRRLFFTA